MTSSKTVAVAICLALGVADIALAQAGRPQRTFPRSPNVANVQRQRPNIYNLKSYGGIALRGQRAREKYHGPEYDRRGLLADPLPSYDSVYRNLISRNLLTGNSLVVRNALIFAGRNDYVMKDGKWAGQIEPSPIPSLSPATLQVRDGQLLESKPIDLSNAEGTLWNSDPAAYNDILLAQLNKKGDAYFAKAVALFRNRDYLGADGYFDLFMNVDNENPRAYAAKTLLDLARDNETGAILNLTLALRRTTSLDDIKLNRSDFYESQAEFERLISLLNLKSRMAGASPRYGMLLAFYQWVNGDLSGAVTSMDAAIQGLEAEEKIEDAKKLELRQIDRTTYAKHFRDLLVEAQNIKNAPISPAAEPTPSPSDAPVR